VEDVGREEVVEDAGQEDLEVAGWEESSYGGQEDDEEEGQEKEGAGQDDEGVGVTGLFQDPHPHVDFGAVTLFTLL
jgi:hypothetical protein